MKQNQELDFQPFGNIEPLKFPGLTPITTDNDGDPALLDNIPGRQDGTPLNELLFNPLIKKINELVKTVNNCINNIKNYLPLSGGILSGPLVVTDIQDGSVGGTALNIRSGDKRYKSFDYAPDLSSYLKSSDAEQAYQKKGDYAPLSAGVPIGSITAWPTYTPPEGWLNLDGGAFDPETYPELYAILGTDKLQDWRGCFPRGPKGSAITVPEIGTRQNDAIRNIEGRISNTISNGANASGAFSAIQDGWGATSGEDGNAFVDYNFDASRVVPTDIENRPYAIVTNFIIKAK